MTRPADEPASSRLPGTNVALLIADWFGAGRSPVAPGTVGAFATLPLYYLLREIPLALYVVIVVVLTIVGIWAAELAARELGDDDPSRVVIDEVLGTLIALGFVRDAGLPFEILAWLLFRFFDIVKPGPIHDLQDLEPAGVGIVVDDLLAGLVAGGLALGLASWLA